MSSIHDCPSGSQCGAPRWTLRDGRALSDVHPCFAIGRRNRKGRIHLPVSPTCNLACRFCSRVRNNWEERPGVTEDIITPEEALSTVNRALALSPDLSVAGIAGPGDALATPYAIETFRLIKRDHPDMILCLSTNGLMLEDSIAELIEVGLDTLTVTINDIDPARLAKLNAGIVFEGKSYKGVEAAEILIPRQLRGVRLAADAGIVVKVNTVLVPSINGPYIGDIARAAAEAGAQLYNIIPLIPNHELADEPVPTCEDLQNARAAAEEYITVFKHCQHCRADAIGVPGERDLRADLNIRKVFADTFSHG